MLKEPQRLENYITWPKKMTLNSTLVKLVEKSIRRKMVQIKRKKKTIKRPKIQRLITDVRIRRKKIEKLESKKRRERTAKLQEEYHKVV